MKKKPTAAVDKTASPPTTPPTIAPVSEDELLGCSLLGVVAGVAAGEPPGDAVEVTVGTVALEPGDDRLAVGLAVPVSPVEPIALVAAAICATNSEAADIVPVKGALPQ